MFHGHPGNKALRNMKKTLGAKSSKQGG